MKTTLKNVMMKTPHRMTRILNRLLVTTIVILVVMAVLALISVHMTLWDEGEFSFSPEGINSYLDALGEYKALFAATVATIAAYYGLWRYRAAVDQNRDKLKMDRFSDWKTVLDVRSSEIEKYDPLMKREFVGLRYRYFEHLYNTNFRISTKEELTKIFNELFKDRVAFFENHNERNMGMGGAHPNSDHSYSYKNFEFLFLGCAETLYAGIETDLKALYVDNLPIDRTIDAELYQAALQTYRPIE